MRASFLGLLLVAFVAANPAAGALRVVTATVDLAALAAAVGGDLVTVESIVPAGADPEAFEPRPGDIEKIRRAALLVRVGLGYDFWLDAIVNQIADPRLLRGGDAYLDASTGIPLLEIRGQSVVNEGGHAHGVANPHYWLDPQNAVIVTAGITEALIRIAPQERMRIQANRDRFLAALKVHSEGWARLLGPFAGTRLIAYHNAWPYFARRFRLDIVAVIEPKPGVAPTPAHLTRLIAQGRSAKVRAILHEPYEPDDASRFLAQKLAIPMIVLAISVSNLQETDAYLALFDRNAAALSQSLGARAPKSP